jgi:hypothetical protein
MDIVLPRTGKEVKETRLLFEYNLDQPVILKLDDIEFHFKIVGKEIDIWDKEINQSDSTFLISIKGPRIHFTNEKYPYKMKELIFKVLKEDGKFKKLIERACATDNEVFFFKDDPIKELEIYLNEVVKEVYNFIENDLKYNT